MLPATILTTTTTTTITPGLTEMFPPLGTFWVTDDFVFLCMSWALYPKLLQGFRQLSVIYWSYIHSFKINVLSTYFVGKPMLERILWTRCAFAKTACSQTGEVDNESDIFLLPLEHTAVAHYVSLFLALPQPVLSTTASVSLLKCTSDHIGSLLLTLLWISISLSFHVRPYATWPYEPLLLSPPAALQTPWPASCPSTYQVCSHPWHWPLPLPGMLFPKYLLG